MPEREDTPWSPTCTHMSQSENEMRFPSPPKGGYLAHWMDGHSDDSMEEPWSPACTSVDEQAHVPMTMDPSPDLSDVETVRDFLLDNDKLHVWVDGSEIRGQAGYGVYFPHGEYPNISRPVVGPQTNNRAEVSAVGAAMSAVRGDKMLCMKSDSKWCVDIFGNLSLYKRRGWMTQRKKPVRHHDLYEEVLSIIRS